MGKIVRLPKQVVDMIAAGEVIERPASVVRELVENALDAGARRVDVRVEEGGRSLVAVADDGDGIPASELPLAVQSHATSKLESAEDLFRIRTLGFRGEALPSIGAVSLLAIDSRHRGAEVGARIEVRGGEVSPLTARPMSEGTNVEVRKLFFNTPVRRRFLRKEATELGHISDQVTQYALAHPSVAFRLLHDGREVFDARPTDDVRRRIETFFSSELADSLVPFVHQEAGLSLRGLAASPTHVKPNAKSIHFFLNGRAIRDRTLLHAVVEAYRDAVPRDRYPVAFIFLSMDPQEVDLNVHPAKIEVRFRNSGKLHALIQMLLREALGARSSPAPPLVLLGDPAPVPREQRSFPLGGVECSFDPRDRVREALGAYLSTRSAPALSGGSESEAPPTPNPEPSVSRPFLQVHGSYIVRETEDGVEIVDQHALNERLLYDEILPRLRKEGLQAQRLLVPLTLDLDRSRASLLEGHLDLFARFGLEINRFGPSTFAVQTVPSFLPDSEVEAFVEDVLTDLKESAASGAGRRIEAAAKRLACRGAVKAGQPLNELEIRALFQRASRLPAAPTCPHGRPAVVRITLAELERSFGRR